MPRRNKSKQSVSSGGSLKKSDPSTETNGSIYGARYRLTLAFIVLISIATRFYDIHEPAHVCWDETHFGKMASWYINRTFFFDVHPPLGKMLIALSGALTGYDGSFAFEKPGDKYDNWSQYVGMRAFCALLGAVIPIFIYLATQSMTRSYTSALFSAVLILFDNGIITLTRYILLDPPLLFFISASILGLAKLSFELRPHHESINSTQFSLTWWFWLMWTGISITGATSVKFVGLFVVALVGLRAIYDLWDIMGDTSMNIMYTIKHFAARILCLIVVPIVTYGAIFWIHLSQLDHSGNGDGFYSSAFQSQLIGNSLHNSSWPAHLAYGSEVTIKSNRIGGAYLHSHWHLYPEGVGARQQQVTTYSHKDSNNKWLVKGVYGNRNASGEFVRDGDLLILEHTLTKRNLHSHFEAAPITKRHYQVTCYGENGIGDANDIWRIVKEKSPVTEDQDDRIFTVRTRFKLVHYLSGCALHSHSRQLPKWAYDQLEVTCNPKIHDKNNFWNIEDNHHPSLPNISFEAYAPNFLDRFFESHAVMLQGNAGLKPKEGEITSRPWQWPINYRGQFFSASKGQRVYLLGNPTIWWANIVTIPIASFIIVLLAVVGKMNQQVKTRASQYLPPIEKSYLEASAWILLGWSLHYIPFYFMSRILYFHHYFPAFIFSSMLTAATWDYLITVACRYLGLTPAKSEIIKLELILILSAVVMHTYFKFIPITYGTKPDALSPETNVTSDGLRNEQHLSSIKWLDSWEF